MHTKTVNPKPGPQNPGVPCEATEEAAGSEVDPEVPAWGFCWGSTGFSEGFRFHGSGLVFF